MKNLAVTLGLVICSLFTFAQDEIIGLWNTENNKSVIEVYKKGDKYFAKIISLSEPYEEDGKTLKIDDENPDEKLRSRQIVGIEILTNLEYDADDKEWNEGNVYDPESGNTYSCFLKLENPDKIYLKGYIGFSWIGRSSNWTRKK